MRKRESFWLAFVLLGAAGLLSLAVFYFLSAKTGAVSDQLLSQASPESLDPIGIIKGLLL